MFHRVYLHVQAGALHVLVRKGCLNPWLGRVCVIKLAPRECPLQIYQVISYIVVVLGFIVKQGLLWL